MSRFDTSGLDALIRDMTRLGQTSGEIAEAMCQAAAAEIRDCWKESAEKHGHRVTGDMIDSIGFKSKPQRIGDVVFQDIFPQGKDDRGIRNAEKAFVLNYGRHNLPPSYWVDEADANAGPRIQSRLEGMWDAYLESGGDVPPVADTGGKTTRRKT